MKTLTVTKLDDDGRKWYQINGYCPSTGVDFDNETFGVAADGAILDVDGCPLTPGDHQTIAVENAIGQLIRDKNTEPTKKVVKKLTAVQFVSEQIHAHRGELEPGDQVSIEYGDYTEGTIRKAIRANGFSSRIDDCGNMFACCKGE